MGKVALRKESVDRNSIRSASTRVSTTSLSARRAWIEMGVHYDNYNLHCVVALRKESVDRNRSAHKTSWQTCVALRKESVDRNIKSSVK